MLSRLKALFGLVYPAPTDRLGELVVLRRPRILMYRGFVAILPLLSTTLTVNVLLPAILVCL